MAERAGILPAGTGARVAALLGSSVSRSAPPSVPTPSVFANAMARDKQQNVAGELRFAVPLEVGRMGERSGTGPWASTKSPSMPWLGTIL
jgi:hypothetical protein